MLIIFSTYLAFLLWPTTWVDGHVGWTRWRGVSRCTRKQSRFFYLYRSRNNELNTKYASHTLLDYIHEGFHSYHTLIDVLSLVSATDHTEHDEHSACAAFLLGCAQTVLPTEHPGQGS